MEWRTAESPARIDEGSVHVWRVRVVHGGPLITACRQVLDEAETRRAARFRFDRDRDAFIVGHGVLRRLLAGHLECSPLDVRFQTNEFSKPYLAEHATGGATQGPTTGCGTLQFNLSHSGDVVLLALSISGEVGVDVERIQPGFDWEPVAERVFSSGEIEAIGSLAEQGRVDAFFRCWTRKEAYVKAKGRGLSFSLQSFTVPVTNDAEGTGFLLRDSGSIWRVRPLEAAEGYAAAIAAEGDDWLLRLWDWRGP